MENCVEIRGKMGEGGNAHRARGRFWDGTPQLVPVFGISNENWTWPYRYQTKQETWEEILDIRIWQVLYQHKQSALINPQTWERHKTWPGLYSKGGSAGLQDQAPQGLRKLSC